MAGRRRKIDPGTEPMFPPKVDWQPPKIADLPSWAQARRVAVDVETKDPDLKELGPGVRRPGSYVCGYSFAIEDGPSFYVPVAHAGGDNAENPFQAWLYLRDQAKAFNGQIVGMNLLYDLDWLAQYDVVFRSARWFRDVQSAEVLLYEMHQKYDLDTILERHGLGGKEERVLEEAAKHYGFHPKHDLWRLPARYVGQYGEADAKKPLALLRKQERILEEEELWGAFDLESKLLPILVKMRRRGVRVDEDKLTQVEHWAMSEETEALSQVYRLTGRRVELGECMNPSIIAPILLGLGIELPDTDTGRKSVDKNVLGSCDHPVGAQIIRARKMFQLRNTYAGNVRKYLINGRIHATLNQMARESDKGTGVVGARWGRMSSSDPNLQNQPSRDEFASYWRQIYLPEEGMLWGSHDYSRQEPRLIAHYAILCRCEGWSEVLKRYEENPDLDDHQMMADLTGLARKHAKNIYMGLCYGEGEAKMSRECGFATEMVTAEEAARRRGWRSVRGDPQRLIEVAGVEGRKVFDTFHDRAPFVRSLTHMTTKAAKDRGYVKLLDGRRCHFPQSKHGGGYDWTHKALNRVIQGGAAVQTKMAMIEADAAGHYLQLVVHDDLTASVQSEDESKEICKVMEHAVELKVPTRVEYKVGPTWGEAK